MRGMNLGGEEKFVIVVGFGLGMLVVKNPFSVMVLLFDLVRLLFVFVCVCVCLKRCSFSINRYEL